MDGLQRICHGQVVAKEILEVQPEPTEGCGTTVTLVPYSLHSTVVGDYEYAGS